MKVEEMVRRMAKEEGLQLGSRGPFAGNSLEGLAKNGDHVVPGTARITYLPSQQKHDDGHLLRLRKNHPETYRRVLAGELTPRQGMLTARKADGERVNHDNRPLRVRSDFLLLSEGEKDEFVEWLRAEGYIKSVIAKRGSAR